MKSVLLAVVLGVVAAVVLGAPAASVTRTAADVPTHRVTFVLTTDPDPGSPGTSDEQTARAGVREQFDGWSQYWRTVSEGKVDFGLDGFDGAATWWPGHGSCASTSAERSADNRAARAHVGFSSGPSKLFVLVVANCSSVQGYGGGSSVTSGGSIYYEGYQSTGVWAHVVGHALGFGHGLRLSCPGGAVDGPVLDEPGAGASGCSTDDYGDEVDVMGPSRRAQYKGFAAPHRVLQGFYGPESYLTVDSDQPRDQTMTVVPRGLQEGRRAIVVTDPRSRTTYYVEYATPVGEDRGVVDNLRPDDFAGSTWVQRPGVRVLRTSGSHGVLLSPRATGSGPRPMYWPVGTSFVPPGGGLRVDVLSQDDGSATLRVVTTPRGTPAPPTSPARSTTSVTLTGRYPAARALVRASVAGRPTTGVVTLSVDGRPAGQATLSGGLARMPLPSWVRPGRHRFTASLRATSSIAASSGTTTAGVARATSKVHATIARRQTNRHRAVLRVAVSTSSRATSGRLEVRRGAAVVARATVGTTGRVSVRLPRMRHGSHRLVVRWLGNERAAASKDVVRVGVRRQ